MVSQTTRRRLLAGAAVGLAALYYKTHLGIEAYHKKAVAKAEAEGKPSPKRPKVIDQIKIVGVVKYVYGLSRDLLSPARLSANPRDPVKMLLSMCWPKWGLSATPEEAMGRKQIAALFILGVLRTVVLNRSSSLVRTLNNTVYKRDRSAFQALLKESATLVVVGSAVTSLYSYSKATLTVMWRERLTAIIHKHYFTLMNYYHVANLPDSQAISNPDELLAREVMSVSGRLVNLISLLASALPPIVWFTLKLWRWRGFAYAMVPHFYLLLAYEVAQRVFPKNMGDLYRQQAIAQGGYYKAASRVQTHSEAIAAIGGAELEEKILEKSFSQVSGAAEALHFATSKFQLTFKLAYTYGCRSWISSFIMLPILYSGAAPNVSAEVADVQFSSQQMIGMLVANGQLLTLHAHSQHMYGVSKRVLNLITTLRQLEIRQKSVKAITMEESDSIEFEGVQVYTPTGIHLVKDLSFALKRGGSLLLTGHNGAGKSSIFRCLGGLWAVPEGVIKKPGSGDAGLHNDIFYLPQKPYNVLGSLRDQLTYPQDPKDVKLDTAQVEALLKMVDLAHLVSFAQNEDELVNWEDKLSLGEQQRLAMARLFYHKPKFAILDECTSAVSTRMEQLLYDECKRQGITYITICHRPTLRQYHDTNLNLTGDGKGGWEFVTIPHEQKTDLANARDAAAAAAAPGIDETTAATLLDERSKAYQEVVRKLPKRGALSKLKKLLKIMVPNSGKSLVALLVAIGLRTLAHESYSFIMGQMFRAMLGRDSRTFAIFAGLNIVQDLSTAWIEEAVVYLQNIVSVSWHKQLTQYATKKFFRANAFYNLKNLDKRIQDPDQRLTREVQDLSDSFSQIWAQAITPLVDIVWFSVRLHSLIGAKGMTSLYVYVGLCTAILKLAMPDHSKLNSAEKKFESQFRFVHTRLRNHAESVAFFGGDKRERQIADKQLSGLVEQMHKVRESNAKFRFAFSVVNKDFDEPAALISTPELLTMHMQLEHATSQAEETDGALAKSSFYVQSAANRTISSFGKLANLYQDLSSLIGSSTRVCEMLDVLDEMHASGMYHSDPAAANATAASAGIHMKNVDIVTPNSLCLAKGVSVDVEPGHSLMVTGHNATGKTSFFRVLAGLWPLRNDGQISRPGGRDVFLVPQRVYSVSGTLADQVTYPDHIENRDAKTEEHLRSVLAKVDIAYLADRKGGWDAKCAWENTLSLGEQQRMGLARLFYHKPKFGVLDECTDAVSMDVEESLYRGLHEIGVTCITISKRLALTQFHDRELKLGLPTPSGWELSSTQE